MFQDEKNKKPKYLFHISDKNINVILSLCKCYNASHLIFFVICTLITICSRERSINHTQINCYMPSNLQALTWHDFLCSNTFVAKRAIIHKEIFFLHEFPRFMIGLNDLSSPYFYYFKKKLYFSIKEDTYFP